MKTVHTVLSRICTASKVADFMIPVENEETKAYKGKLEVTHMVTRQ